MGKQQHSDFKCTYFMASRFHNSPSGIDLWYDFILNEWMHHRGDSYEWNMQLYLNVSLSASMKAQSITNVTRADQHVGRSNWSVDGYLDGMIDELRIYSRPSADEVSALLTMNQPQVLPAERFQFLPAINLWFTDEAMLQLFADTSRRECVRGYE